MIYTYDFEFSEAGNENPIKPYSIGIVAEDGRTFYRETPYSTSTSGANEFVLKNVFPHFIHYNRQCECGGREVRAGEVAVVNCPLRTLQQLRSELVEFFKRDKRVELWGYFCAYDHVAFCQLFGSMSELPSQFPYYTKDIRQFADHLGFGKIKVPQTGSEHSAIDDAQWTMTVYRKLRAIAEQRGIDPAERTYDRRTPLT